MENEPLLSVRNLKTYFFAKAGLVKAIDGIDFDLCRGETLALVGESGCGKSATALSLLRLVPEPGKIVEGSIHFNGQDLRQLHLTDMRKIRGNEIAMIFQEPMTSLNPVYRIGEQIGETLKLHRGLSTRRSREVSVELLQQVGIPDPEQRLRSYPHQLSGGMRQRVMIAMALSCSPDLLIADEPTTALDVTIQAQIMALLRQLQRQSGMSVLLITHDLGIVAEQADRVAVMYAGRIVESATVATLFANPQHPYTEGLLHCLPRLGSDGWAVQPIPGQVPTGGAPAIGCAFRDRCPQVFAPCHKKMPPEIKTEEGHIVRCWRYGNEQ